jgi:hypothetical protein
MKLNEKLQEHKNGNNNSEMDCGKMLDLKKLGSKFKIGIMQ